MDTKTGGAWNMHPAESKKRIKVWISWVTIQWLAHFILCVQGTNRYSLSLTKSRALSETSSAQKLPTLQSQTRTVQALKLSQRGNKSVWPLKRRIISKRRGKTLLPGSLGSVPEFTQMILFTAWTAENSLTGRSQRRTTEKHTAKPCRVSRYCGHLERIRRYRSQYAEKD